MLTYFFSLRTYLLLFRPLKLCVPVLVISPSSVERPLLVALRALQLVLQDVLGGEEDDVGQVLHLQGGRRLDGWFNWSISRWWERAGNCC